MLKETITYVDFNGTERTEDFYFHLSQPEVVRIEAEFGKSVADKAKELAESQNLPGLIAFLEKIVLQAYGKKTVDGKSFKKSDEIREEFEYSQAYAELFEKLLTDKEFAAKFGEGIVERKKVKPASHPAQG